MMKDWLNASLFYVSNEPGFRVNTNPRRTYTISLSSSMMYIRQIQIFTTMQILVQAQICTWLIVYTKTGVHMDISLRYTYVDTCFLFSFTCYSTPLKQ